MKLNKILIGLIFAYIVCIAYVSALSWSNNSFNNSLTNENLTFTANQSITRHLAIPSSVSSIMRGFINLSSFYVPLQYNPIMYLALNETTNNTAYNLANSSNNGTFIGPTSVFEFGLQGTVNNSIRFITADNQAQNSPEIDLGQNLLNTTTNNFTMSLWTYFNYESNNSLPTDGSLWGYTNTTGGIECYIRGSASRRISFDCNNGTGQQFQFFLSPSVRNWTNYILQFTSDGTGQARLWQNGILIGEDNSSQIRLFNAIITAHILGDLGSIPAVSYNVTLDEIAMWHDYLNNSEIQNIISSSSLPRNINIDIGDDGSNEFSYSGIFNQQNNRSSNLALTINRFLNATYLIGSNYVIPFLFHSDTAGILQYLSLQFNNIGLLENSQTYTNTTFDTQRETFSINITYDTNEYTSSSATIYYNGTGYLGTSSLSGNNYIFTRALDIPVVQSQQNYSFYWTISLTNSSGTEQFNSTTNNQTVNPSIFLQCGTGALAVNYTIRDEETNNLITSNFDATFNWKLNSSSSIEKNTSVGLSGTSVYSFCINTNQTFITDAQIELSATNYQTRLYTLLEENYNNQTTIQNLYLLGTGNGTNIIIEVKNPGNQPLEGYTVKIFRFNSDSGNYTLVKQDVTDLYGQIVASLIENTVKYRFEFYDTDLTKVLETSDITIACRATICILPFVIEDTIDYFERLQNATNFECGSTIPNFQCSLTFNNNTNVFTFSWNDNTGDSPTLRLEVIRYLVNGTTTICNNSSSNLISSLTCNVGNQRASYIAQAFRTIGNDEDRVDILDALVGEISATFGLEGLLISFIFLFIFITLGIFHPGFGISIYLIGIIFIKMIGIVYLPWTIIIAQIVIGIFFIWAWRG